MGEEERKQFSNILLYFYLFLSITLVGLEAFEGQRLSETTTDEKLPCGRSSVAPLLKSYLRTYGGLGGPRGPGRHIDVEGNGPRWPKGAP